MNSGTNQVGTATKHQIWWQLSALVVVSVFAVYAGTALDERIQQYVPEAAALPSIYNKKPSGLSGLLELVHSVGLHSQTWKLPYRQLKNEKGMLIIVSPGKTLADFEAEQILSWVETGNDLVYLDHFSFQHTRTLLNQIGLEVSDNDDLRDVQVTVNKTGPEFAHVPSLIVSADTAITGGVPEVSYQGKNLFSSIKHGKGRILIGTVPSFCANRRLSVANDWPNFQFLINWMSTANGAILFDERCHGFGGAGNVFVVLAKSPWGAVFAQALLLMAVAVTGTTRRFGSQIKLRDKRQISNLEFINGLSNAYRRAKANSAILEITGLSLRGQICKQLGVSPHEPTDKIIEACKLAQESGSWTAQLNSIVPEFLTKLDQALKQTSVSDSQFKGLIATCDKIGEQLTIILATPNKKG